MFHVLTINLYLIIIKKNKNVKGKNGIFCSNIKLFQLKKNVLLAFRFL